MTLRELGHFPEGGLELVHCHVGRGRPSLVQDLLQRQLEQVPGQPPQL